MRLFIAINLPAEIQEYLRWLQNEVEKLGGGGVSSRVRLTCPRDFHLTLKFLGEVDEIKLEEIKGNLRGLVDPRPGRGPVGDDKTEFRSVADAASCSFRAGSSSLRQARNSGFMALNGRQGFSLRLGQIGFFGSPRAPRVIWVDLQESRELTFLQQSAEKAMIALDFPREERPFAAHLTLARVKFCQEPEFTARVKTIKTEPKEFFVREFALMQSFLSPAGARYEKIHAFPLTDFNF